VLELWSGVRIAFPQAVMILLKVSEASRELLIFFFIFFDQKGTEAGSGCVV
jgi:hypothetical protein